MNCNAANLSEAKDAIAKFHNGSYPDMVKNSVLLLNYLHQHSFISRPIYSVVFERLNPPNFATACSVNQKKTLGTGNSKKAARTQAADKMLNILLNPTDCISADSNVRENLVKSGYDCSIISSRFHSDEAMNQNFYDSHAEERISCETFMETMSPSQNLYSSSPNVILQPQCSGENTVGNYCDGILLPENGPEFKGQNRTSIVIKNNSPLSIDDYFDPYFHLKKHSSQTSSASSTSSDVENVKPCDNVANGADENLVETQTDQSSSETTIRQRKKNKRVKLSNNSCSYILDSYFDPFFKLKPKSRDHVGKNNPRSNVNDNSTKVNEVRVETEKIKSDKTNTNLTDIPKLEKAKSPFAILQEKSIKNFKLIPRCSIERCDDGFKCKLVLDSYSTRSMFLKFIKSDTKFRFHLSDRPKSSSQMNRFQNVNIKVDGGFYLMCTLHCHRSEGIGQSKKLAKINAAIVLLQQLEEHL